MKQAIQFFLTLFVAISTLQFAHADFENVIVSGPNTQPIHKICKAYEDRSFVRGTHAMLNEIKTAIACGKLGQALSMLEETYQAVAQEQEVSKTPRGWCYEKRACSGDLVYKSIITKSACTAADGKSWKQTSPKAGKCKKVN